MEAQNAVREREKVLNEEVVRLREELERQRVSQTAVIQQAGSNYNVVQKNFCIFEFSCLFLPTDLSSKCRAHQP